MKQIGKYFFDDNFSYVEETLHGVNLFVDGKNIYQDKQTMFYNNAIGRVCEKCGNLTSEKYNLYCDTCSDIIATEKYLSLGIVNETKHLYSAMLDEFFDNDDWTCIHNYLSNLTKEELFAFDFNTFRIHPCKDSFAQTVDIANYFEDTYDGFDLDSYTPIVEINEHINKVNELILANPIGYEPIMNKRITIDSKDWEAMKSDIIDDWELEKQSNERA